MNKILFVLIIVGLLSFLALIPGVIDSAIYHYYRMINGETMRFDNKCYSVPDGWFKTTKHIDSNSGYMLLQIRQETYEDASVFSANKYFQHRVRDSASLQQIDNDLYSIIYNVPSSSTNGVARYWLIIPSYNLIVDGRTVPITESLSIGIRPSSC